MDIVCRTLNDRRIEAFEVIIGYRFSDRRWIRQALTHSSFSKEASPDAAGVPVPDYERLEFLGDAVLELTTSRMLFDRYDWPEGSLTRERARIVCETSLAFIARKYGFGEFMLLGNGEEKTGGRDRSSILCDLVESIIGAVFQDGGYEAARDLIERIIFAHIEELPDQKAGDPKTMLQEYVQARKKPAPTYRVIREEGPPHDRTFTVELLMDGEPVAAASGKSKKKAEQEAAQLVLERINK